MKKRLNILSILVFIVLGLSLYTTGYQFGTGMKAGMSLAKEQHKESKACDRPMLAGDFRFVDVVPTIAMIQPDTIINARNNEKVPVMYTQMAVRTGKEVKAIVNFCVVKCWISYSFPYFYMHKGL